MWRLHHEDFRRSPFYDLLCTVYYPDRSATMAMKIGGEYIPKISYLRRFDRLSQGVGLGKPMVKRRILGLAKSVQSQLPEAVPKGQTAKATAIIHIRR